jgi:hypothetical protein
VISLEERLTRIVALLPEQARVRFTAPLTADESTDSRLVEAVRCLAKAEGLVCMTPGEFARANAPHTNLAPAPAADDPPDSLATRFAAITDPRAQTAFWRSLTAEQRAALTKAK